MNTKVAMLVAVGCVASFAATNYDLLGRNGSKMNSPMVYRDVDYQKVKASKQQGINSPLENKTLKKSPTGLNGPAAVEGAFSTHGLAYSKNGTPYSFYFKRFNSNGIINFGYYEQLDGPNNTYLQAVNSVFIPTNVVQISKIPLLSREWNTILRRRGRLSGGSMVPVMASARNVGMSESIWMSMHTLFA